MLGRVFFGECSENYDKYDADICETSRLPLYEIMKMVIMMGFE